MSAPTSPATPGSTRSTSPAAPPPTTPSSSVPATTDADASSRARRALNKPITSELGGVGPVIVVPGPWSAADLRYQAEHVATMKFHNAGCNCVAAQVLVLPAEWELRGAFLDRIRQVFAELPPRPAYYPGAAKRRETLISVHPNAETFGGDVPRTLITGIDPGTDDVCFPPRSSVRCSARPACPAATRPRFSSAQWPSATTGSYGTLGATILVHPATARDLGPALEQAVADLRYGAIGVNVVERGRLPARPGFVGGLPRPHPRRCRQRNRHRPQQLSLRPAAEDRSSAVRSTRFRERGCTATSACCQNRRGSSPTGPPTPPPAGWQDLPPIPVGGTSPGSSSPLFEGESPIRPAIPDREDQSRERISFSISFSSPGSQP